MQAVFGPEIDTGAVAKETSRRLHATPCVDTAGGFD